MIRRVLLQTIVAKDLEGAARAIGEGLGWERTAEGTVGLELAAVWGIDAGPHPRFVCLAPPGAARGFLRLVDGPEDDLSSNFHRPGFFNAELLSRDVDAAHARLAGQAGFRILCAPQTYDMAAAGGACSRSFATRGPGGAGVFLTTYLSVPPPRRLPEALHLAGPMFNAAVSTDDLDAVVGFYEGVLGLARRLDGRLAQPSINRILGLPEDWGFRMLVYKGEGDGLIEVDVHEHPLPLALPLPAGHLKPGNSILTLETDELDALLRRADERGSRHTQARTLAAEPYAGRRAAVAFGPVGERIELVEA
ncbi:MAG: VOC family protein [Vicinamibacteria bacterium]